MASGLDDLYTVIKLKDSRDCEIVYDECKTYINYFLCKYIDSAIKYRI
jgi:hypothetical protein